VRTRGPTGTILSVPAISVAAVRILHTSDWHLGRSFHREGLLDAQAAFVDSLLETVRAQAVDLVVVAGDVYDRAVPPVDAVHLANEALQRLAALRIPTVITSGNHDSASRLGFAADLITAAGVHLRTDCARLSEPVLLDDRFGPVAVYGLPYLEPESLTQRWQLDDRSHAAVTAAAMAMVRADLAQRAAGTRSVVLAHSWVTGGTPSDSERDISVGGVCHVPVATFDDLDYVALGHLHGRQQITPRVRYSGSPLAYSFSETDHVKGSWLVELGNDGFERADFVAAPIPRRLGRLRGRLDDLLTHSRYDDLEDRWLQVTLTDRQRPRAAMERLREGRFPHVLMLGFEPEGRDATPLSSAPIVTGRSERDIVTDFVTAVREVPADLDERALLEAACEGCRKPLDELMLEAQRAGAAAEIPGAPGRRAG